MRCSYCSMTNHSVETHFQKKRYLQSQIAAIDAASGTRSRSRRSRQPRSSASDGSANTTRQDGTLPANAALMAAAPAPSEQPPPLPAVVPSTTDDYFKKNLVSSSKFW